MRPLLLLSALALLVPAAAAGDTPPVDLVDPLVGTRNMGHTFPGATVPFGGVQLSPDTRRIGMYDEQGRYNREVYRYCAGYQYEDSTITGFSHTHFSGTGHSDLGDVSLMPVARRVDLRDPATWTARFDHASETAVPGYYAVTLEEGPGRDIAVELTATTRCGRHRYTFAPGDTARVVLDLTANIYDHEGKNVWSFLRVENDTLVTGWRMTSGWARTRTVYFALAFDRPITTYRQVRLDETPYTGFYRRFDQERDFPELAGRDLRVVYDFGPSGGGPLQVKVGLSSVSAAGAVANLRAEAPGWDFEATRADAHQAWNTELSRVRVRTLTAARDSVFNTALYHTMLGPVVYEDVDGRYRGLDQNVHVSDGFTNYTIFSLWDTYRAQHPWLNLVQPARNRDMIRSMLAHYDQSVHPMLPVWSHHANENWCMIGYHAVSVIADAAAKQPGGFDLQRALSACATTARVPYFDGVGELVELGYVSDEATPSSVSVTLELAYDDWCIAQLARLAGDDAIAAEFDDRARSFENVFDARIGFMRPRLRDGSWRRDLDVMATHGQGFIEGNAWNYSLYVPHDVPRLVQLHGGPGRFGAHLDSLFTMEIADEHIAHTEDITRDGIIGNYVHGNEPGHHIIYLYNWSDRPWRCQQQVRQVMDTMYGTGPAGLCGNDDLGQMSAWYLFSALGFYPVCPGSTQYALGSPLVQSAELDLENGRRLTIRAQHQSADNVYVQQVSLNGIILGTPFVDHADLMRGGELVFEMGPEPANR